MPPRAPSTGPPRKPSGDAIIASRDNRWLKEFRMALRGGLVTESGAVGVEGVRLVEEALRSGAPVQAVLFSESGERHRQRLAPYLDRVEVNIPVLRTTDRLFEGIADTERPQGVAALVVPRTFSFDDISRPSASGTPPLIVVLAGVQDPGNVGTILRTAAAFGATAAVTSASGQSGTASPFSPKALRASAGAGLHLPLILGPVLPILLAQLKASGIQSLASSSREPSGSEQPILAPWQVNWCEPVALLIGNEGAGLPEEIERSADVRIRIPMSSSVESLNAAAAAAVLFYEAARQRSIRK
ncbi:MAG TPA: RNA methyltransferase [Dongiaceae bacterium]|nr:RNA methyltransferase [Dongiaceae bacterium]